MADDIGRQVLSYGYRQPLASFFEELEAITKEDLCAYVAVAAAQTCRRCC